MNIAHVCTPHGLGHLTRQIALALSLKKIGCTSTFYCHNPSLVYESLPDAVVIQKYADVGLIQSDIQTIDTKTTLSELQKRCTSNAIEDWSTTLKSHQLVIADIPPLIFEAAKKANIPVLGIGNFDWIWIYNHFPALYKWSQKMKQWQHGHHMIQLYPGTLLYGSVKESAYWLAREGTNQVPSFPQTRILIGLGGLTTKEIHELPAIEHVCWILPYQLPIESRTDIISIKSVPFPDLMRSVDIIFSKAGYSVLAEAQVTGTPQIWMKRQSFPEASILESFAQANGDIVLSSQWGTKKWKNELQIAIHSLASAQRTPQKNENDRLAQWIVKTYFGS